MSIDVMKQTLQALESFLADDLRPQDAAKAITALRTAIEQAKRQEPVAWQWLDTGTFRKSLPSSAEPGAWRPLYTAPPQKQTQEPLGFMNACHVYEMQQGRLPYGYVYPKAGTGAGVAVYTAPPQQTHAPIAWGYVDRHGVIVDCITPEEHARAEGDYKVPLYTAPRQRQPLTEWEIIGMKAAIKGTLDVQFVDFARAIEAAHGIDNDN